MAKRKLGIVEVRRARRSLRGAAPMGVVSVEKAAQLLDCPAREVFALIASGSILTVFLRGERLVPLSEIRRRRQG